ncbi:AAA family ATPase [Streptomyces sp. NPDC003480]
MYVTRLRIDGVRGFQGPRAVDLDFQRPGGSYAGWTVIAGRNGSGKTTLLQAIALCTVGEKRASLLENQLEDWLSLGRIRGEVEVALRPEHEREQESLFPQDVSVSIKWQPEQPTLFDDPYDERTAATEVHFSGSSEAQALWYNKQPRGWLLAGYGPFRRLSSVDNERRPSAQYRRSTPSSRSLERVAAVRTLFQEDAALTEAVAWMVQLHLFSLEGRDGYAELLNQISSILDNGLLPDGYFVHDIDADGLWLNRGQTDLVFPLRQMSDGYRTVVALVLDIIRRMHAAYGDLLVEHRDGKAIVPHAGVILIDEVDAHLHVSWQQRIGPWLKEHFPNVQFIVTSHSPYVCQAADEGGLIRLPGPDAAEPPEKVTEDLYRRIIYGTGDDVVLSELFGIDTPYSESAQELRRELVQLESSLIQGEMSDRTLSRIRKLKRELSSSPVSRVDEVSARLLGDTEGGE